jgi:leucyl/phenylalanyl-tRNA--protein transferase
VTYHDGAQKGFFGMKLTSELLVTAYAEGIFPMGIDGEIRWFSPDPRAIIPLDGFHVPHTLRQRVRQGVFEIRVNTAFAEVMRCCGERPDETWITPEIVQAYCELHGLGLAHSVEAWKEGRLVGGLYGVSLGGAFFGESMFHRARDASKVALAALVERMRERRFTLLDTQFLTEHLVRFGAIEIPRGEYMRKLTAAIRLRRSFADEPRSGADAASKS